MREKQIPRFARDDNRGQIPRFARDAVLFVLLAALSIAGCKQKSETRFELLAPSRTGVTFANTLPEDTTLNILNYLYYYNGGGVAVGDINNDGLPDLYFTSNLGANRLYLNKGNYQFQDVTSRAGVADSVGWKSGATMADVNGDGYVDIYVSGVNYLGVHGRNVLYVNNGNGTFTDRTKEYGLDFDGLSTQALFFDYDNDGDLDMYLLNHSVHAEHGAGRAESRNERSARTGDRLYRNDSGHFVDVSAAAHIYGGSLGFGLGVVASDFDSDGCLDLYVANDFQEDDFLYHNNCDGTFTEVGATALPHTSRSSMGVDAADVNDDGRPDLVSADMLPEREDVLKTTATVESFGLATRRLQAGYRPQFARNALQLNRGDGRFSDIGFLAGVAATDWSWAPLFADFDNDGRKDLFITSGVYRRPNDLDYLVYVANPGIQTLLEKGVTRASLSLVERMPKGEAPNHLYRNTDSLSFDDVTHAWGLSEPGFSNGAAYVDLNNTGSLDLVVNRVNAPAAIYRNRTTELDKRHYLRVALEGDGANTAGIGAKVSIWQRGARQVLEQMPTRGFQSSVDPRLHFGLGDSTHIDSLVVVWPGGRSELLTQVAADQTLLVLQKHASPRPKARAASVPLFADVTKQRGITWRHDEHDAYDFEMQPLIPRLLSSEGPALAVGDVNGDGLDDMYVGGAKWQPGELLIQQRDGTFSRRLEAAFMADSLFEDVDAEFFDANGDGRPDLYVVSGGYEFAGDDDALQDRLYINDGNGTFHRDTSALPRMAESGSCVVVSDFDGDGHPDMFVGRRAVARTYGVSPRGYLLKNDGKGRFRDVTMKVAPGLVEAGMVTSAAWMDYDGDGHLDLVVTGEWMPVRVFHQEGGRLVERTTEVGFTASNGWWNSVTVADVNGDKRPDLVLGNLGRNAYVTASQKEPARLYLGDFAHNHGVVSILTAYRNGASHPIAGRDELAHAIPWLREKYPSYASFGAGALESVLPKSDVRGAKVLEAYDFATSVAINNGNGTFTLRPLPVEAQFAPARVALAEDFDDDGRVDLLLAGNDFGMPPVLGRYDASYGLVLRGDGKGQFRAVDLEDGIAIEGQVRHLKVLRRSPGGPLIVVARNNDTLQLYRLPMSSSQRSSSSAPSR
ncbi:MAG TPA: VCBS repeat-containing protein [Gemmatimonadaceae bacterium]